MFVPEIYVLRGLGWISLFCILVASTQGCVDFGKYQTGDEVVDDSDSDGDSETETGPDQGTDTATDEVLDTGTEIVEDTETEDTSDSDLDGGIDTETETIGDTETAEATETEDLTDTESDTITETETDTDTVVEEDTETNIDTDTHDEDPCPEGTICHALRLIAAGLHHNCAIMSGRLNCWGENQYAQLGDGTTSLKSTPERIGAANDWQAVTAGSNHTCALRAGDIYCFGDNFFGQRGDGSSEPLLTPQSVAGSSGWIAVASGHNHTCGVRDDMSFWCWGSNFDGKLGQGSLGFEETPHHIPTPSNWTTVVAAFGAHTCGLVDEDLYCWGSNTRGQLGDRTSGIFASKNKPQRIGVSSWNEIAVGEQHTCGLQAGRLFCWGYNALGQVGDGTSGAGTDKNKPTSIDDSYDWTSVSLGSEHTCGLKTGALFCWGQNNYGQLGDGTSGSGTDRNEPVPIGVVENWDTIALGGAHTCGIAGGELYCWGYNYHGQLGDGTAGSVADKNAPTPIGDELHWSHVDGGWMHTCGLRGGELYCWGFNVYGQLGIGTDGSTAKNRPVRVGEYSDWNAVSTGSFHTCGILDGDLYCWGSNQSGQLGLDIDPNGIASWVTEPQLVDDHGDWENVTCGGYYTCGLRAGELYCWGRNDFGQLGNGRPDNGSVVPARLYFAE